MSNPQEVDSGSSKQALEQSHPKPIDRSSSTATIQRLKSFMRVPQLAKDAASKKKRIGLIHSAIMGFCLLVLLMTILVTQEPFRYIRSNLALQRGALISSLQEDPDLNIDTIWEWMGALNVEIGGQTYQEVELNCGYGAYDSQTVEVDGKNYTMLKPDKQEGACATSSLGYIDGVNDPLYLIGSHQVLAIGAFTKRANTNFPIAGSAATTEATLEVNSDKSEPLNPLKDNKVIEVCSVRVAPSADAGTAPPSPGPAPAPGPAPGPGPASLTGRRRSLQVDDDYGDDNLFTCIHKDGFANEDAHYTPGATMNWEGEVITYRGEDYYAYDADRIASIFEDGSKTFTSYPPCYIIGEDDGLVYPGVREFTGTVQELRRNLTDCTNTWISKGRDFRTQCLKEQNTGREATAQQSYLAGLYGFDNVPVMYEGLFGCQSLINWDVRDIDNAFVEARRPIESYLSYDKSYGAFFPTSNEQAWVEAAIIGMKTLNMHGFFDKQTTEATLYIVTRNLDERALFYTLVKISFTFRVNGYSNVKYRAVFSPMSQYEYGMDGYGWRNRQMFVWEILFLILYSLFVLRELYQLLTSRIFPCVRNLVTKKTPVHPNETEGETNDDGLEMDKQNEVGGSTDDVPVVEPKHDQEQSVENKSVSEVKDIEGGSVATPPPSRGKIMTDFNHDGRDDLEQLESFMHDLNDNGIDDAEELMDFVDDILPDAAGLLDILDWVTIGIMSLAIYYRLDYIYKTADLHELFIDLAEEMNYHESMTDIISRFSEIDENLSILNTLNMFLVFFGIVQFFRYLSFDRRLGIVTATIKESTGSLLPVLLIFMVVMFAYSVLGTVMYGAHLNDWSNIGKSMSQLFLLILGEFGTYFDIMQINPHLSAIFFWSYITMALFLLFNMVLAVIFTVYDEKNTEIKAMEAVEKEAEEYEREIQQTKNESKKDK